MITSHESSDGSVVLAIHGAFDADAGRELGELLAAASPESHAILDFSDTRIFPDSAIAVLAPIVRTSAGTVSLVGLGSHQLRLLEYLGVEDLERLGRADAAALEALAERR